MASKILVAWSNYESDVLLRPDFGILCYPVIASQGLHAYAGSMRNLAGQDPSPELLDALSSDRYVGPERRRVFYGIPGKIRPFRLKIVCSLLRRCVPMTCPLNCIYTVEADMAWVLAPTWSCPMQLLVRAASRCSGCTLASRKRHAQWSAAPDPPPPHRFELGTSEISSLAPSCSSSLRRFESYYE